MRPTAADHTKTPGTGAVTRLSSGIPHSARYQLSLLLPHINVDARSFPLVFETVLNAADTATAADGVSKDDLEQAVAMAQQVKAARTHPVFEIQEAASLDKLFGIRSWKFEFVGHVTVAGAEF